MNCMASLAAVCTSLDCWNFALALAMASMPPAFSMCLRTSLSLSPSCPSTWQALAWRLAVVVPFMAAMTSSMPPSLATLWTYDSGPQFTLCRALMAFSWTPGALGCSFMASTTAWRPPRSKMTLMASSEQAMLCMAKQAFSCSTAALGKAFMAATMASTPPSCAIHRLVSSSKARLPRAMQACSCSASQPMCACIAWTMRSTPLRLVISMRFLLTMANCCSAQQPFSCTMSLEACSAMARSTASTPPARPMAFWFSSLRRAMLPRRPQPFSCRPGFPGWLYIASTKASMPPSFVIFALLSATSESSSRRSMMDSCFSLFRGSARMFRSSTTTSSSCASGPRQASTAGSERPMHLHLTPHFSHTGFGGSFGASLASLAASLRHPQSSRPIFPRLVPMAPMPESQLRSERVWNQLPAGAGAALGLASGAFLGSALGAGAAVPCTVLDLSVSALARSW
mmetsp:Transcript_70156/g.227064  ORF Transcript_70156/g.227064 Transcript_70156/m.227064 type:complete len:455 (-) Transcript_70156:877-2241(-)